MSDLENPNKPKIIPENRNDTTLKSSGHEVGDKAMPFLLFQEMQCKHSSVHSAVNHEHCTCLTHLFAIVSVQERCQEVYQEGMLTAT